MGFSFGYLFRRYGLFGMLLVAASVLAGCASGPQGRVQAGLQRPVCVVAPDGALLPGNWLSVREQRGVAGKLHTQVVLNADGTMVYVEQLQRKGRPPQTLNETGCWSREGARLLLQTLRSNSVDVELDDPIYRNEYAVLQESATQLRVDGPQGVLQLRRMDEAYRLPLF